MTTALSIVSDVQQQKRSAVEVACEALAGIERAKSLNAFISTFPEHSLAAAAAIDRRIAAGEVLPLAGVPIAVKDNICLGPDPYPSRTTCASRFLESYESPFTATAAQKLIEAGAVVVGKTNMDEFGMGSSSEHSYFGPVRNSWDPSRVPGGSSGGSAVSVAAGITPIALGSDTGGSIRQPASHCGVVGLKPTYGRVSRYGLVAYASSLDQIGPLTSNVADAALALSLLSGIDRQDATTSHHAVPDFLASLEASVESLHIGVPRQYRSAANHPAVTAAYERMIALLVELGATIVDIDLPLMDEAIAAYYIVAPAEASSNLARFDGIRFGRRAELAPGEQLFDLYSRSRAEGFGPEVKRRIMLGTHVLSSGYYEAYYNTALKVRRRILHDYNRAFGGCEGCPAVHAILSPTAPEPAFKLGEKTSDPLAMYLEDVYTVPVNLAGLPAMTIPAGSTQIDGVTLPMGMQLIAPAFDESTMLRISRMIEIAQAR